MMEFTPCQINPEHTIVSTYRGCFGCDMEKQIEAHQRKLAADREARISETVEIARRIIPLVIEAIRQYDEESRK